MFSSIWQSVYLRIVFVVFTVVVVLTLILISSNFENLPTFASSLISNCSAPTCLCEQAPKKETDLIILLWMWPFGSKFSLSCAPFNITGCFLTDDKALYSKAHGVIFHHRDIHPDLQGMPKEPRPSFQKWVWYNMESPSNSGKIPGLNNLFNLTATHRQDSDIFMPHGNLVLISEEDGVFTQVPTKERLVCWIVSNWNTSLKRVEYYDELKKYIEIKTFGKAFGQYLDDEQYVQIMKSCRFYLSFENSLDKDYITEKFFQPLELGTVPVVLGPPREDYEAHAPGNAFIHVDDFPSPKELAERLKHLNEHPDEYMSYFDWRNSFKSVPWRHRQEIQCRTCHYLKTRKQLQMVRNLNQWFWG